MITPRIRQCARDNSDNDDSDSDSDNDSSRIIAWQEETSR